MRTFRSEAGFRARKQAADVLVVSEDDQQGNGALHREENRRARP
jgi:hypothetical protein